MTGSFDPTLPPGDRLAPPHPAPPSGRRWGAAAAALGLSLGFAPPAGAQAGDAAVDCPPAPTEMAVPAPAPPRCDNELLSSFDGLLIIAPHPDDEVLGFGGLADVYRRQGKPVEVIVSTDGDAYCDACRFWKSLSVTGPTCGATDLSNLATAEVDSFAEVRRGESRAAAAVFGLGPPTFLGYPDTGLAAAWRNRNRGEPERRLRRSDFSACGDCETCTGGYGEGPVTELSAAALERTLAARIAATSPHTLLATTHWLDGHGDHAALGNFVKRLNDDQKMPRPVVYAVIHAHTPRDTAAPDCWYPTPEAPLCPCALQRCATDNPGWLAALRHRRFLPEWPSTLPDDAPYGAAKQLCLEPRLYRGEEATKLRAVRSYASQLGFASRSGEAVPGAIGGLVDCNGYLTAFVRRTEAFVLERPAEPTACRPDGVWRGTAGAMAGGAEEVLSDFTLELRSDAGKRLSGEVSWTDAEGARQASEVAGKRLSGCRLKLHGGGPRRATYRGSISRDRASLYGSWGGRGAGFFVVHR